MRFVVLLSLLCLVGLAGCGPAKNPPKPEPDPKVPNVEPPKPEKMPEGTTPEKKPEGTTPVTPKVTLPATADVATLIDSLKKAEARECAVAGLKSKGAAVVPSLIEALEKDQGEARQAILVALGAFGKDASAALPALKKIAASEKDPAIRDTAQFTIDALEGN